MGLSYPNVTLESLDRLLHERFSDGFLTLQDLPQPSTFKDMDRATERIVQAIKNGEKITIIGDYDVDGVVSTTLMKRFFDEIDISVEWIIPNRFRDGYGLSEKIIPKILGTDLAITVDNGISALNAAKLCKDEGIELIITDHHIPGENLPEAYALVNQKQEECNFPHYEVCGAQIAWYLIASIKNTLGIKVDMMPYMGLVAIAVIADIMPLLHINRVMVSAGLKVLGKGQIPAIKAFMEQTQKGTLEAEDIAFFLAPLINSAGRMDDAKYAVEFLLSKNIYDARVRLQRLQGFNETRKETEEKITKEALRSVDNSDEVLVLSGEDWHEGVVGIVAARIARRYNKPAIILSNNEGTLKGSGRSVEGCDLFEIVDACREYLEKFGGHKAAIGLSLEHANLIPFKSALQKAYQLTETKPNTTDPEIVGELNFALISFELTNLIKQYEPFGHANTKPKFITQNVRIAEVNKMGKEGNHLRMLLEHEGHYFTGVKFKTTETFEVESRVTITYRINENHFNGKVSLQLLIEDIV
jgi:single-stranded-DNA-specific exonuclease